MEICPQRTYDTKQSTNNDHGFLLSNIFVWYIHHYGIPPHMFKMKELPEGNFTISPIFKMI